MSSLSTRRSFLAASAAATVLDAAPRRITKAVYARMLPKNLGWTARFELARTAGFEQVECVTCTDPKEAEEIRRASQVARLPIHSVMNQAHWKFPLSSADPRVAAESMKGMETSLENASLWGANAVLLVPAVVDASTSYRDAWTRSQRQIRKLLPLAQRLRVAIAVENVWNKFLLSPLEFARYVDEFQSPWVRAYFDVGNIVLYGYPQDWIRTLGPRILKLHLKDFKLSGSSYEWAALREGDVDWPEVRRALSETGYSGTATCELPPGDEAYLREVSRRMDQILGGA
jgi:L-ribulose-5-phosphate 3-epimerase